MKQDYILQRPHDYKLLVQKNENIVIPYHQIQWISNTHDIPRLIGWKCSSTLRHNLTKSVFLFTTSETTDSIPWKLVAPRL